MKNGYTLLLLLPAMIATSALAQTPTPDPDAKDKSEVRFLAKKRIESDLQGLYNTLTFDDVGEFERELVIKNSYLSSTNQVFYNDDVLIEDDIDPKHLNANDPATVKNWRVGDYLKELDLRYAKTTSETIRFSNLQASIPERKGDHYEVRMFYTSKFGGIYMLKSNGKTTRLYYDQSTSRVATLRADKIDGKWQVLITQILFLRPTETLNKPAPAVVAVMPTVAAATPPASPKPETPRKETAASNAKLPAANPGNLAVGGAEQEFYQPTDNAPVWFKWDLKAMQVVRSESAQIPAGFFRRGSEKGRSYTYYAPDSSRMVVQQKDTIRYRPAGGAEVSLLRKLAPKPTVAETPAPEVAFQPPANANKMAADLPKPASMSAATPRSATVTAPPTKTPTISPVVAQSLPPTISLPAPAATQTTKPFIASVVSAPTARVSTGPVAKPATTLGPGLNNTMKAEQAKMVKRYQTQGWLQLAAGVAGLVGGYLTYSSLQRDYGTYKARVETVNNEYDIWREMARQPAGQRLDPVGFNSYASPGIFAAYGAGLVGAGLAANGVLRFGKAKKVKKQVWK